MRKDWTPLSQHDSNWFTILLNITEWQDPRYVRSSHTTGMLPAKRQEHGIGRNQQCRTLLQRRNHTLPLSLIAHCQTVGSFEIICENDGSSDSTLKLIQTASNEHSGLIRYVDQNNTGLWNARWSGTDVARGKFVAYVDSDDYVSLIFCKIF